MDDCDGMPPRPSAAINSPPVASASSNGNSQNYPNAFLTHRTTGTLTTPTSITATSLTTNSATITPDTETSETAPKIQRQPRQNTQTLQTSQTSQSSQPSPPSQLSRPRRARLTAHLTLPLPGVYGGRTDPAMPPLTLGVPSVPGRRPALTRTASAQGPSGREARRGHGAGARHVHYNDEDDHDDSQDDYGARPSTAPGREPTEIGPAAAAEAPRPEAPRNGASQDGDDDQGLTMVQRKRPSLAARSRTDYNGRPGTGDSTSDNAQAAWGVRHGFEDHYQSEEIIVQLANGWYMYYTDHRHETTGKPNPKTAFELQDWRMRERLKTVSAALVVCLNIGVEPPDQLKTNPGAKLEAWEDPGQSKGMEAIGKALQAHYTDIAIRTRYKQYLDPSVEDTKKFCLSLRRSAKDERILFHYNGHGVPKPTASGEIWVFNRNFTQYIPVSLYDLQNWLQAPTIYVWDCSEAGHILQNYEKFVEKHEAEEEEARARDPMYEKVAFRPFIHLAACRTKEHLPTNPLLPADVFTACLTTPIEMALWSFVLQNPHRTDVTPERAKNMPGRLQERRTPKGELMWILTAITDTIAWTTLSRDMFRRYFRQDLMVAGLFRNFLLAQRIMAIYGCHPQSYPPLPDTHQHPQWGSWDLAVDLMLSQLPQLERRESDRLFEYDYVSSSYFAEQLSAFEVYLTRGDALARKPPEQLPVVLQVLLSQQHRVRALILLGRFLDMGPWAVQLALSIGIFPYVVKLLQSNAPELKPVMVFIWTKIIAVDISCQADLIKDSGYAYFANILDPDGTLPLVDGPEHKAMCAFVLAMLCRGYRLGQASCNGTQIMSFCLAHLREQENPLLRQWACLCLSQLWNDLPEAKWRGLRENAPVRLAALIQDRCCEVRAAVLYAMTTFIGIPDLTPEVARMEESLAWTLMETANDGSPVVRKEFVVFLSHFVLRFENKFVVAAYEHLVEESDTQHDHHHHHPYKNKQQQQQRHDDGPGRRHPHPLNTHQSVASPPPAPPTENRGRYRTRSIDNSVPPASPAPSTTNPPPQGQQQPSAGLSHNTVFAACWKHLLILSTDPHPEVQRNATVVVDYVHRAVLKSPIGPQAQALRDELCSRARPRTAAGASSLSLQRATSALQPPAAATPAAAPSLLRRTASLLFTSFLSGEDKSRPSTPPTSAAAATTTPFGGSNLSFAALAAAKRAARVPLEMASAPPEQNDQANAPANYGAAREPVSGAYVDREVGEEPKLPLASTFLDWSVEYFREPQMRGTESAEPGSADYNERLWRRSRNEHIMTKTQPQKAFAGVHRWNHSLGQINNGMQPAQMTFHQFEDHLAVADDGNTICVWDWGRQRRLSRFSNGNPVWSVVSGMRFINEDDQPLLLTGASDGVMRVYRNYDSDSSVELASAWRALTHMVPSNVNSGMVFDWQQVTGRVLVAGDVRVVRVWSAADEMCLMDVPARSGACVTSLTSDQMTGNIFIAGFGDGAVRAFDIRQRPQDSLVRKWKDDTDRHWIKSVHMQRGGQRELMSAGRDGKVKLWDIRMDKPLSMFATTTTPRDTLRTASLHEHLPVFAVGTSCNEVKIFNLDGQELSRIEPYSYFLNTGRGTPISATAFHPHRAIVGCAARGDNHINLYSCYRPESMALG